jgi:hypothetical protein
MRETVVHHRKPRHLAEKMESWMGRGFVVIGGLLLAGLLVAFMQTGNTTPAWMH